MLAACGGGDAGAVRRRARTDVDTLLKHTFTGTHDIKVGKAERRPESRRRAGAAVAAGPITCSISGPFESQGTGKLPKFDLALDATRRARASRPGLTSTSDQAASSSFGGTSTTRSPTSVVKQFKASYEKIAAAGLLGSMSLATASGIDPLAG